MRKLFRNRLAYLSLSLILLVLALPLISQGTTSGAPLVWWAGLAALVCGGLIPPLQRLLLGPPPAAPTPSAAVASATSHSTSASDAHPSSRSKGAPQ